MPELAEVEYYRRQWTAGVGARVERVELHRAKRLFRGADVAAMEKALTGAKLLGSETRGKQMLFRFSRDAWLGIHLGMTGKLSAESADFNSGRHDHLVLFQKKRALVFTDARMFGRVRFALAKSEPEWWASLPPALTSPAFTLSVVRERLHRARRAPIKAVLLDQAAFPGVGNWMADEILWQASLHPALRAGDLPANQQRVLWQKTRAICRTALKTIGVDWSDPPETWLIHFRWKKGGHCPRDGGLLQHATIGGRTTAWCPRCQQLPQSSTEESRVKSPLRIPSMNKKASAKNTSKKLKPGDRVEWNTSQGKTKGRVQRKVTSPMKIKRHKVAASKSNPQMLVQSEKSGELAAHKPRQLRKVTKK